MEKTKTSSSIPPVSSKQKPLSVDVIRENNHIRWSDTNREYGYLYDEVGEISSYINSKTLDWDSVLKNIIDQVFIVLRKSTEYKDSTDTLHVKSILHSNHKAILSILESTKNTVNNVDKQEIICRIQSYIDNSI